jgi:hypothetical protein
MKLARRLALVLLLAAALTATGCGSKSSSTSTQTGASTTGTTNTISHAKTKFVFHAGLAFGAFHHWIYLPAKAGDFAHPFLHKLTVIKAGLAGLFVYHELKLALQDARADPTLSKLVSPITALDNKIKSVAASIKSGHPDVSSITQTNSSVGSIGQLAADAGQPVRDLLPSHLTGG